MLASDDEFAMNPWCTLGPFSCLIHELRGTRVLGSSLSLYRMFMHGRSGERPNSPPEYPLGPHILIHAWIDIHALYKHLFVPHGLAIGEVCVLVCTT